MCGLFGFIAKEVPNRIQIRSLAITLAQESQIRGEDAAGYATLEQGRLIVRKKALCSANFLPQIIQSWVLLGHTRHATIGSPYLDGNAHPFTSDCGRYALSHNGSAYLDYSKQKSRLMGLKTDVDSEAMLRYLENKGFDESGIINFYKDWFSSSFAIAILDKDHRSLILFHNEENEIYIAKINGLMIYASTEEILASALKKANFTNFKIRKLDPYVRYEFFCSGEFKQSRALLADKARVKLTTKKQAHLKAHQLVFTD